MDYIWENPQLRQQILNQFGNSTGICCMSYHFREEIFCFSDNIKDLTSEISDNSCSLEQWYHTIYEGDRHRLQRYMKEMLHESKECYTLNYRLRNRSGQLVWVSSKGTCIFDEQGNPMYFLGFLATASGQAFSEQNRQSGLIQKLRCVSLQEYQVPDSDLLCRKCFIRGKDGRKEPADFL